MALKFTTKPDAIHKMLSDYVVTLPDTTLAFHTLVSAKPEGRPKLAQKIHDLKKTADQQYITLTRKVAGTFIAPYDREDLYRMVEAINDVIDSLDHATYLVVGFKMGKLPEEFLASAVELVGMSEQARDAVQFIKKPNRLEKTQVAINKHKNVLEDNYRALLINSMAPGMDNSEAMKLKILADIIEQVSSQLDRFTRAIAVAAIKGSQ